MRKSLLFLLTLFGLLSYAQTPVLTVEITKGTDYMKGISSYASSFDYTTDDMVFTVVNFNNNNNGWSDAAIRCGRKGNASVAYFATKSTFDAAISKVDIQVMVQKNGANDKLNSLSLVVADDAEFTTNTATYEFDITEMPTSTNTTHDMSVTIDAPAANKYYKLVFDCKSATSNGFMGLMKVVYYGELEEGAITPPAIALGENNTVTISAEEGLSVYYTTDESEPTTESTLYSEPFTISGKTTVKAIASDGTKESSVATAVLLPNVVQNIAEFLDIKNTAETKINAPLTAIYQNGRNLYVKDASDNFILVYNNNNLEEIAGQFPNNGDVMSFITGTYKSQNGLPELIPTAVGEKSTGEAVEPETLAIEEIGTDMLNKYVRIENVSIAASGSANNYTATDDTGTITIYNSFNNAANYSVVEVPEGDGFTLTGFVSCYNSTIQITPVEITGGTVKEPVADPVIAPESGTELNAGDEITITCETEGAEIRYTVDGTTPTAESTLYETAIAFEGEEMTVKAIALKEGMLDSEVVTATYSLYIEGKHTATFKFNEPETLNPNPGTPTADNTQIKLNETNGNNVFTADAITLTFGNGTNTSNSPVIIYPTGSLEGKLEGRIYTNNTITIAGKNAYIRKVTFNQQDGSTTWGGFTSDPEATVTGKTFAYSDELKKVTLTTKGTTRYISINVEYIETEAPAIEAPEITLGDNNTVSITAAEGMSIYYTTDETEPTAESTLYSEPFTISGKTTVKAIATDGEDNFSEVTSAELTPNTVGNIAEFIALANATPTKINAPLTAVYQNGRNLYLKDAEGNFILAYNSANLEEIAGQFPNNGDVMSFITGTYKDQKGLPELIPSAVGEKTAGEAVEPETLAIEEIGADMLNKYIRIENVNIVAAASANNYTATDETGTINIYNTFNNAANYSVVEVPEGDGFTITGFVSCYNTTLQITPVEITGGTVKEPVATPVIAPESGSELNIGDEITITCETEGAEIRYTLNGDTPTAESSLYSGSILYDGEEMTVKAIAIKEGMLDSEVATATYTLYVEGKHTATFNFNEPETLNPYPGTPTVDNTQIKLNEKNDNNVFTAEAITLTFSDGENSNNSPVIIYSTAAATPGLIEGRIYINNTMTFTAKDAYITKISFTQATGSTNWKGFNSAPESTESSKTFSYSGDDVTEIVLTSIGTSRYTTIQVDYIEPTTSIDSIIDSENATAPVEYYNLQGIRVNAGNMTPGIYVRRQGTNVSKVLVK